MDIDRALLALGPHAERLTTTHLHDDFPGPVARRPVPAVAPPGPYAGLRHDFPRP